MIVILAGIENIPQELYDAGTIDGVNEFQKMRYLTIPLIRTVIIWITLLEFIGSLKIFDIVWVMTKGGPSNSSEVLITYLYKKGFQNSLFGFSSAIAVIMLVFIFGISYFIQRRINYTEIEY